MNRDYGKKSDGFANGGLLKGIARGSNGSPSAPDSAFGPDSELPGQDGPPASAPTRPSFAARAKAAVGKAASKAGKPFGKSFGKGK